MDLDLRYRENIKRFSVYKHYLRPTREVSIVGKTFHIHTGGFRELGFVRKDYRWELKEYILHVGDYHLKTYSIDEKKPHIPPYELVNELTRCVKSECSKFYKMYDWYFQVPSHTEYRFMCGVRYLFYGFNQKLPIELIEKILSQLWRGEIFSYLWNPPILYKYLEKS